MLISREEQLAIVNSAPRGRTQGRKGESKYLTLVAEGPRACTVDEWMVLMIEVHEQKVTRGAVYRSLWALAKRGEIEHRNGYFGTKAHFEEGVE